MKVKKAPAAPTPEDRANSLIEALDGEAITEAWDAARLCEQMGNIWAALARQNSSELVASLEMLGRRAEGAKLLIEAQAEAHTRASQVALISKQNPVMARAHDLIANRLSQLIPLDKPAYPPG